MKKKMKWRNRIFWLRILIMVLVIVGSYLAYAFIYRGRNEPPTKRKTTNQEAAYYTLRGQIQMLSQKEELMAFAFEDRKKEREYGTYIIPGLKATQTLLTSEGDMPAMCTTMTPQGLAVTEDYVFVSAYCHAKKHNSVIYMINKESHRFIKEIILPGQPHVGGLAYDSEHQILWYSSNTQELAQAVSLTMESIENYDYDAGDHHLRKKLSIDSFISQIVDHITNCVQLCKLLCRNLDVVLVFQSHNKLEEVKGICSQVILERSICCNCLCVAVKLLCDHFTHLF